jgi:transposase
MAFLRAERKKSGTYLRIVETYRSGTSVRHRTLYSLGKVEDFEAGELEAMGRKMLALAGAEPEAGDGGASAMRELGRFNYGYPLIVKHLLRKFELDTVLARFSRMHRLSYSLTDCLSLLLCDRLRAPGSKRNCHATQEDYIGLNPVNLQHLYRSLGYLDAHSTALQQHLFERGRRLLGTQLDVVFYDVTTFYFDSEVEQAGALRQMGFGKDGKIGQTQVVFGLLVDQQGNPVGYRVYSGDTYEGRTLSDAVTALKREYGIRRVIVVADSGMMSKTNLGHFAPGKVAADMEFIVADRLKSLQGAAKDYLCDLRNYQQYTLQTPSGDSVPIQYAVLEYQGRLLLGTYSAKRARKDAHERENRIERGRKMLENPSQITKKAAHFYLTPTQTPTQSEATDPEAAQKTAQTTAQYHLDEDKIARDAQFDGFWVLATNALDLTPDQILSKYKDLYHVEHSFRCFKSFLETRPMFHWTDSRIRGHLCVCYIAYALLAYLQNTLRKAPLPGTDLSVADLPVSEATLRRTLDAMQVSRINHQQQDFFLRANYNSQTLNLLKTLKIPPLAEQLSPDEMAKALA